MTHAAAWMNLEDITLNEVIHLQKNKYYIIPLTQDSSLGRFIETENRMVVVRSCRG